MNKIVPDIIKKWYWNLLIPFFCIIAFTVNILLSGYSMFCGICIVLCVVFAIFWGLYVYYQQQSFRIEYGEGKIVVCRISGEYTEALCKRRKDIFYVSELKKWGFSSELFGKSREYHKWWTFMDFNRKMIRDSSSGREIAFCLKNGKVVCYPTLYLEHGQLHDLMAYIEQESGMIPKGTLASSLLTAKFKKEKINIFYDKKEFPKNELKNVKLSLDSVNTYFKEDAVVIYDLMRVVYIPYSELYGITVHQIRSRHGACIGLHCCYWLANGTHYSGTSIKQEDGVLIATYMKENHPEIETDFDLVYLGLS
ncbi:MAG: hypothetical protein IJ336_01265 [Lachnospiraceae bacterium]|nr:hypothetical protein [Lachnospiraceae bacterium]